MLVTLGLGSAILLVLSPRWAFPLPWLQNNLYRHHDVFHRSVSKADIHSELQIHFSGYLHDTSTCRFDMACLLQIPIPAVPLAKDPKSIKWHHHQPSLNLTIFSVSPSSSLAHAETLLMYPNPSAVCLHLCILHCCSTTIVFHLDQLWYLLAGFPASTLPTLHSSMHPVPLTSYSGGFILLDIQYQIELPSSAYIFDPRKAT